MHNFKVAVTPSPLIPLPLSGTSIHVIISSKRSAAISNATHHVQGSLSFLGYKEIDQLEAWSMQKKFILTIELLHSLGQTPSATHTGFSRLQEHQMSSKKAAFGPSGVLVTLQEQQDR